MKRVIVFLTIVPIVLLSLIVGVCGFLYFAVPKKNQSSANNASHGENHTFSSMSNPPIESCNPTIDIVTSQNSKEQYDYYTTYLEDKTYTLSKINSQNQIDFTFAFLTDLHWPTNAKKSPFLLKKIDEKIPLEKVVLCGDYINSAYDDVEVAKSVMKDCTNAFSMFNYTAVIGNHDGNTVGSSGDTRIPDVEVFNLINNCNSSYPYSVEKDYNKKICLLFLNTSTGSFVDNSQKQFIYNNLTQLEEDWLAILFIHIIFDGSYENNNESVIQPAGIDYTNFIDSFSQQIKCSIVGTFSGHSHLDYLNTTSFAFPVVTTMCDSIGVFNPKYNIYRRELNSCTEQAFDIVQVNKNKRKVFLTRIGCGSDRCFNF